MINLMTKSTSILETPQAVQRLAAEHPDWLPVLDAAAAVAAAADETGGEFAGSWVVSELARRGAPRWIPNLPAGPTRWPTSLARGADLRYRAALRCNGPCRQRSSRLRRAPRRLRGAVESGELAVADLEQADYLRARELLTQYRELRLGFVDAAVVAIVERLGEQKLATLDHRHFSVVRPRHVTGLELLPA
jgi:hypothetical protein